MPSGGSATSPVSGTIPQCIAGANWNLTTADKAIVDAWNLRTLNSISDCKTGDNWATCRDIMNNLSIARDNIFQTFDQNHDGKNDCKINCLFDTAAGRAKALIAWEEWLWKRHFSAAAGLSTIYYTINERRGIPMCGQKPGNGSMMAGGESTSSSGSGSGVSASSAGGLHPCNDPSVPTQARWKFYRYIFGGGGTSYAEKKGLICYTSTSYYTYAGGGLKYYICDDGMVNCRRSDKKEYIYTDVISRDTGTEYQYADQGGYAVRSSKSGAPEETTIIMGGGESEKNKTTANPPWELVDCPTNAVQYRGNIGQRISCGCTGEATGKGSVYGNLYYTDDSSICRAAVHAGKINTKGGRVMFSVQEPHKPSYEGITKNGITSTKWGSYYGTGSFTFGR